MFFFFGTTDREALRGVVVDLCPVCRRVRRFSVIDLRRTMHLYFIPLGQGRYQGSVRRCVDCGQYFEFDAERYSEVLAHPEAEALDLEQGLRRTTPRLAARFEAIDAIERTAGRSAYRVGIPDPDGVRLHQAAGQLRQLELSGVDSSNFARRLARWEQLGESERESLLAELRGYAAAVEDAQRRAP